MRLKIYLLLLFVMLVGIPACGKKEVKTVSPESRMTTEAFSLIETVRDAYIKRDLNVIQSNSTANGYQDIAGGKKVYESVELTFTPKWVEIDGSTVKVNVSWKGVWLSAGKKTEDTGLAVFILDGKPLKVTKIQRANPFIRPER